MHMILQSLLASGFQTVSARVYWFLQQKAEFVPPSLYHPEQIRQYLWTPIVNLGQCEAISFSVPPIFPFSGTHPAHLADDKNQIHKTKIIKRKKKMFFLSKRFAYIKEFHQYQTIKQNNKQKETSQKDLNMWKAYITSTHQRHKKCRNHHCSSQGQDVMLESQSCCLHC